MLRAYSRDVVDEINRSDEASTFIPALGQSFARNPTEIEVAHAPADGRRIRLLALPADPPELRPHDRLLHGSPRRSSGCSARSWRSAGSSSASSSSSGGSSSAPRSRGSSRSSRSSSRSLGIAMAGLGIVGEYVGRIYEQVRGRPRFSVRRVYGLGAAPAEAARPSVTADSAARPPAARGAAVTRIAVFAYSDTGHACLKSLLDRGRERRPRRDARRRPGRGALVSERRGARAVPRDRAGDRSRTRATRPRSSASGRAAPELILSFYYRGMLPESDARGPAARRVQHARLAPAEVPRPGARQLGGLERRDADGGHAARHDAAGGRRRHRGPGGRADRAGRHGHRGAAARHRRRPSGSSSGGSPELEAGRRRRLPQDESPGDDVSAGARPEDGRIDWTKSAKQVHDLVRAVTHPYPGAFTDVFGGKTWIWKTRLPYLGAHDNFPGQVRSEERPALRRVRRRPVRRGPRAAARGGGRDGGEPVSSRRALRA